MFGAESPLRRYQSELDAIDAACDELVELNSLDTLTAQQLLRRQELAAKLWMYNTALGVSENWVPTRRGKRFTGSLGEYVEHLMLIVGCVLIFAAFIWVVNEALEFWFMFMTGLRFTS